MLYRYLVYIVFSLTALAPFQSSDNATKYPVVLKYIIIKFGELPNFYEELKLRGTDQQYKSKLNDFDKSIICNNIFGLQWVIEPDDNKYKKELEHYNPAIFEELFKEDETRKGVLFKIKGFRSRYKYNYDNTSKFRTFLVGENECTEQTFACVIENSDKTQFKMYYVSDFDYNMNDVPDQSKLVGRFIFFGNQIYVLAEELPPALYHVKKYFIRSRNGNEIAEKWENDPVCKLDLGRKLRLCTYICAYLWSTCEDEVAIQEECKKRKFLLENKLYQEWMLTCKITHNPSVAEEYGITRSYKDNEVYIFKLSDEEPKLLFGLRNGIVIDKADDKLED